MKSHFWYNFGIFFVCLFLIATQLCKPLYLVFFIGDGGDLHHWQLLQAILIVVTLEGTDSQNGEAIFYKKHSLFY